MTEAEIKEIAAAAFRSWDVPKSAQSEKLEAWLDRFWNEPVEHFRSAIAEAEKRHAGRFPTPVQIAAILREKKAPAPAHRPYAPHREADWTEREMLEAAREAAQAAIQESAWAAGYPSPAGKPKPSHKSPSECAKWADFWRDLAETYAAMARGELPPDAHVPKITGMMRGVVGGPDAHAKERERSLRQDAERENAA